MKKMAIGILALAVVAGGLVAPATAQPQQGEEFGWMYLSLSETEYVCDGSWTDGSQTIYFVVEAPSWGAGDAYNGFEFGIDYPATIFNTGFAQNSPFGGVVFGGCPNAGRCSFRAGSGGPISDNPWTAMNIDFLGFGIGDNVTFFMTPPDVTSIPGRPAWLYYDANNPPIILTQQGDDALVKPAWQRAYVHFNYVQVPGDDFLDTNPCNVTMLPSRDASWGALKAGFDN